MVVPQEFLSQIASTYEISEKELEVLSRALEGGGNLGAIAKSLNIKPQAARKRLGEVYRKFSIRGRGPGKLAQLQTRLVEEYKNQQQPRSSPPLAPIAGEEPCDWGSAPDFDPDDFYGRSEELQQLNDWIGKDAHLLGIFGITGMGKTWLAVRWVQEVQSQFDFVIWRSLRHKPLLSELLADWCNRLSLPVSPPGTPVAVLLDSLMQFLRTTKTLLILDDLEDIFSSEKLAGHYAPEFEDYKQLFQRIATERHQGCLVLISSEKLTDWVQLEGAKVKYLNLEGSLEVCQNLLEEREIAPSPTWEELIKVQNKNPFAVKMMASSLQELYQDRAQEFFKSSDTFSRSLSQFSYIDWLLKSALERFSREEKYITYWLALQKHPVTTEQLEPFWQRIPNRETSLLSVVRSLDRRSLLEKSDRALAFSLPRYIRRYFFDRLIEEILAEIKSYISPIEQEIFPVLEYYPIDEGGEQLESLLPDLNEQVTRGIKSNTKNLENLKSKFAKLKESPAASSNYLVSNLARLLEDIQ